jgi:hypothetical protein
VNVLTDPMQNRTNNQIKETENFGECKHVINEDDNNVRICEAVDCFADATNTIEVEAGNHRTISLSLCNICVNKFVGSD